MKAKLVLENGIEFEGFSFGAEHSVSGEVVFNTGMVGYPETLTDTSYRGQILVMTYPLVGNYGVPAKIMENGMAKNFESEKIQLQALAVSDYSFKYSHWNAKKSLAEWLKEENIPAICGIDTRALTKALREKGVMLGKIAMEGKNKNDEKFYDPNAIDIVKEVSVEKPVTYNKGGKKKIVLIDCGVKNNIIRNLIKRNLEVLRVPYDYNFLNEKYDGLLVSNGPGDPKMCKKTVENVGKAMEKDIPIFGICIGNQILALAAGGDTYKLKYGHRSQNQPCILDGTKRCFITSQNHGFAAKNIPKGFRPWFTNANDNTNEGIIHTKYPFMSVQFHPEATPGPVDTEWIFDYFLEKINS